MVEDGREWFGEYSGTAAGVICTHAAQALLPQPTHPAPQPPRRLEFPAGTIPIVFYVHSRPEYFEQSMAALASAAGVSDTIIVISHDGLYPEMDAIVDRLSARLKLASHGKHAGVYQLVHNQCEDSDRNAARYHGHDKVLKVKAHWWWMMVRPIDCLILTPILLPPVMYGCCLPAMCVARSECGEIYYQIHTTDPPYFLRKTTC
jgi:hypothetical protein